MNHVSNILFDKERLVQGGGGGCFETFHQKMEWVYAEWYCRPAAGPFDGGVPLFGCERGASSVTAHLFRNYFGYYKNKIKRKIRRNKNRAWHFQCSQRSIFDYRITVTTQELDSLFTSWGISV